MRLHFALLMLLLPMVATAKSIYVAQSALGSDSGNDAADAHSAAWFNTAGNWGVGGTQVNPRDAVHLVGTITNTLTVQASGASSNPTIILFDSGAYTGTFVPSASDTVARGQGKNLSSFFTTDFYGNTRPASANWTIGAFENTNSVAASSTASLSLSGATLQLDHATMQISQ